MRVIIEGTITPSTFLAYGERRTVERTPFVDKLVRRGFATVIEELQDVKQTPSKREARAKKDTPAVTGAELAAEGGLSPNAQAFIAGR
jgi:hypothetical protein